MHGRQMRIPQHAAALYASTMRCALEKPALRTGRCRRTALQHEAVHVL
jgi:sarcosine oxidase gamma subunit